MGVIFDLDQTIINSEIAEVYRNNGNWARVYSLISEMKIYSDMIQIIESLKRKKINVVIVTSSPRPYCEAVVKHWEIPIEKNMIVAYRDTLAHKPSPEPYYKAMTLMNSATNIVAIGDDSKDIIAAKRAGIISIGCTWGSKNINSLRESNPDYIVEDTVEIRQVLTEILGVSV